MTQRPWSSSFDRETRQQLDELDALIQRMLALPVEAPGDFGELPIKETAKENSSDNMPAFSEANCPPITPVSPVSPQEKRESLSHSPENPSVENEAPASVPNLQPANQAPATISVQVARRARPRWPMYLLHGINLAFDQAAGWFGPPGHWLRGPSGRAVLGWSGLLLLAAAFAWLVWDGLGWTW
jgi:hypothetical protein